jgi:hypothetical protein
MSNEMEILFPEGKTLTIGGEEITIKPLTFGQVPKASKMVAPIIKAMAKSELAGDSVMDMAGNWADILAIGGDDLLNLIGWAIGKDRAWFDTIQMDDGVELVKSVIEVNSDFFTKKVLSRLNLSIPASPDSGATSSPSSSAPGTAAETSTATP